MIINGNDRLVVVGASLAGLRAVEAARKADYRGTITLIGAEAELPYDRPPLSKAFLEGDSGEAPVFCTEEYLRDELGVDLRLGGPATALDVESKSVHVGDDEVPYDSIVIATGSRPRTLPGASDLAGVHGLRSLADARAIRSDLREGAHVVIVGAGFIGSEVASSARKRGAHVTIVEAQPVPLFRAVGPLGTAVAQLHRLNGTTLLCGVGVEAIRGEGRVADVLLDDGRVLPADLVVVGIGVEPATDWLAGSQLHLENGISCDSTLHAGAEGVYAAGDVVQWLNEMYGKRQRMENWTAAAEQGAHAARNALNPTDAKPYSTVPYFWSDWYGSRIQYVGIADDADDVEIVEGMPEEGGTWIALYRSGERLRGALAINGQADIMKYRTMIAGGKSWSDAKDFASTRRVRRLERVG